VTQTDSLARGAAVMTIASAVSRITGFLRVAVVAAAMGTTFLANTYQTANTAPNVVFELVAAGVLTSVFVPTFVSFIVRGEREEGWDTANVLTSVALAALIAIALVVALAAPLIMRLLTIGVDDPRLRSEEIALGATFLRLFAPQIIFYGVGMIMTGALHAYRSFLMPAVAPIFNNVVVIVVYLTYAGMRGDRPPTVGGITTAEKLVLGAGTTLGVVAMTICLWPALRRLGWRFRINWNPAHPAVARAARLGAWALGYAGGYQVGLIVVLMLANRIEGGVAAYQWAYTFFYVPHAVLAVPIFNVLFPMMSEDVARGDKVALVERLREGLAMLVFILVPIAALMVVISEPLARITLEYGVMTQGGAQLTGRVIAAFAVGLPTFSAFLVITRAFYALGDTRTPAIVNAGVVAVASLLGGGLFLVFQEKWAVAGLAAGHSVAFAAGTYTLGRLLSSRVTRVGSTALITVVARALMIGLAALVVMAVISGAFRNESRVGATIEVLGVAAAGALVYVGAMNWLQAPEWLRLKTLMTARGRRN
jgi:putative peptidoglycan lipid II flippase